MAAFISGLSSRMKILTELQPVDLKRKIERLWEVSAGKIWAIDRDEIPGAATPVYTVQGKYTARGWTEWTQGFVYGSALLQFDAFWDRQFLRLGRERTVQRMAHHITHTGVHDHGFNNVSTYGNLWRLMREGRLEENESERHLLRAGAEMLGRGAGDALDASGGWHRVHSFLQRPALALRGHDPLAALAGAGAPARARADGRAGREDFAAAPARGACARDGEMGGLLRGKSRRLRRARPRGAREHFQCERRHLPLPELAAGILAVHHLDARPGVDHVRLRGVARVDRTVARSASWRRSAGGRRSRR